MKVLCVDDNRLNLMFLEQFFKSENHEPIATMSTKEAIELCRTCEFDLIVVDLIMPDIDGLNFVKIIKSELPKVPPVILLSAFSPSDINADTSIVDAVVGKPFEFDNMLETINKVVNGRG